jgi:Na+-transporting methylmalonyl-CoA/oxaloacetate decarboxylase gamma subunit
MMDKTKNIYTLIILGLSVVILFGVFFMVFRMGILHTSSENEAVAIERLHEINEKYIAQMDSNLMVVTATKAALDSFMVHDEQQFLLEQEQIEKSQRIVSRIPHLSNDSLKTLYVSSWNYLLNEYRTGRLRPAK